MAPPEYLVTMSKMLRMLFASALLLACAGPETESAIQCESARWYQDSDGDGHGDEMMSKDDCLQPDGFVSVADDCDDSQPNAYPGAQEIPYDGIDNDCDGEDLCDVDGDGYLAVECGGTDCKDDDPAFNEAAEDSILVDRNCDGQSNAMASAALLVGDVARERAGDSVAGAGDVNGDGYDDFMVSSIGLNDGHVYLFLGSSTRLVDGELRSSDSLYTAAEPREFAGDSVAGVGDVNADGYDDILIGASMPFDDRLGCGYLLLGSPAGIPSMSLADAEQFGFAGRAGASVSGLGDINGDGFDDMIVGAWTEGDGTAFVILGSASPTGRPLYDADAVLVGEIGDDAAEKVAGGGDIDGDGLADVLIGARQAQSFGTAYVLLGAAQGLPSGGLPDVADAIFSGELEYDGAEYVANGGDIDGDGYAEILVGKSNAIRSGVYIVRGSAAGPADMNLANADAYLDGASAQKLGTHESLGGGDANGDGFSDLLLGAYGADLPIGMEGGGAFIVLGGPAAIASMDILDADVRLGSSSTGEHMGGTAAFVGDLDSDGASDMLISAERRHIGQNEEVGAVYLLYGDLLP